VSLAAELRGRTDAPELGDVAELRGRTDAPELGDVAPAALGAIDPRGQSGGRSCAS
jgi:hypothetical protein